MKKQILNPYLPEYEYIPDGEPRVFGNRVYIYGSHDRFGGKKFCLNDYVCYTTANGGTIQGTLAIIGAIPTVLGMLLAVPLANKIGKRNTIMGGAVLAILGGALGLLFPANLPIVIASFITKALGSTPAMYLSLALLADVYDHQEARSGFRTDGFTMTIYGAIMAGMTGIATGVMNGVLSALNYSSSNISSGLIRTAMPWLFIGVETICYAAIFVLFLFMNVEKFSDEDHAVIAARTIK